MRDFYCGLKQTHVSTGTVLGGQNTRMGQMEVEMRDSNSVK